MARDYENLHDVSEMSDRELRDLVQQQLAGNDGVDADNVTVIVEDGLVRLTGRIGTEEELRVAERVVSDVLGITRYANELVVDPIRRDERPAGADDAAAEEADADTILGKPSGQHTESSDHLVEDVDARLYGTRDVQDAIEQGESYSPPDRPTPEGLGGTEATPQEYGEDH